MWAALIPIIAQYGIPLAEALYKKWSAGKDPTDADWAELRALASQSALDRAKAVLASKGIPLDSEQAQLILSLISK